VKRMPLTPLVDNNISNASKAKLVVEMQQQKSCINSTPKNEDPVLHVDDLIVEEIIDFIHDRW
jgi:hypothetical protein